MKNWFKAVLFISLYLHVLPVLAEPCNARDLPKSIYDKVEKEDFSGAEAEAMRLLADDPDDKEAQVSLAKVYINSALRPVYNFDFQAMGIDPNKGGDAQKVDIDKLTKNVSRGYAVNPDYESKAENQINLVLNRWPESRSLLYCMTKIKFYSRDHEKFLKMLLRTAEAFSDEEEEAVGFFLGYAQEYFKHEETRKAADVYETLLNVYPNNAPLLSSLGVSYMYMGRTAASATLFDRAYEQDPEDKLVIGNIAELSMLIGDFDKAERFLKIRAKMLPDDTSILFDLAMNAMHKGVEHSLPYWEQYLEQNKKHPDGKQWSHAAEIIYKTIKENGMSATEQLNLANQLIEGLKAPKYAVPLMSYLQAEHTSEAAYPYQLSHAYDKSRLYDLEEKSLLETYKRLQQQPSQHMEISVSEVLYNLARSTYSLGKHSESLKYLDMMQLSGEEKANTGYMYGLVYIKLGNIDEARKYLERCSKASTVESLRQSCRAQLGKL